MHCINVSYKVSADKVAEVEEALKAHAEHMKTSYISDNPRGDNPVDAYFTKAEELNNPTNPAIHPPILFPFFAITLIFI